MSDPQAAIRAELRRRRRMLGLSQAEAGRVIGIGRLTYHRIESGERKIRFAELATIARAFHCTIDDLVGERLAESYRAAAVALGQPATLWQPPRYD